MVFAHRVLGSPVLPFLGGSIPWPCEQLRNRWLQQATAALARKCTVDGFRDNHLYKTIHKRYGPGDK
jgi:hypothetical protein